MRSPEEVYAAASLFRELIPKEAAAPVPPRAIEGLRKGVISLSNRVRNAGPHQTDPAMHRVRLAMGATGGMLGAADGVRVYLNSRVDPEKGTSYDQRRVAKMMDETRVQRWEKGIAGRIADVSAKYPKLRALVEGGAMTASGAILGLHASDPAVAAREEAKRMRRVLKGM